MSSLEVITIRCIYNFRARILANSAFWLSHSKNTDVLTFATITLGIAGKGDSSEADLLFLPQSCYVVFENRCTHCPWKNNSFFCARLFAFWTVCQRWRTLLILWLLRGVLCGQVHGSWTLIPQVMMVTDRALKAHYMSSSPTGLPLKVNLNNELLLKIPLRWR